MGTNQRLIGAQAVDDRQSQPFSRGMTDAADRLLSADDDLAELHHRCGGDARGVLAVPELLEFVQQARRTRLRMAREFAAFDGSDIVRGCARIRPLGEAAGGGCELQIDNWHREPLREPGGSGSTERLDAVARASAEATAWLDASQRVQSVSTSAHDLRELVSTFEANPGRIWTEYVLVHEADDDDADRASARRTARCAISGSERDWTARLLPIGPPASAPPGFELLLTTDEPLERSPALGEALDAHARSQLMGNMLASTLREPIERIVSRAETVHARLAGPLRAEYAEYAGNIASAGQHLSAMLEDLVDLEAVEAPDFTTAKEQVNLLGAAQRAVGIMEGRARQRDIALKLSSAGHDTGEAASGEFRRVLQILINLVGNAIASSPQGSQVRIDVGASDDKTLALTVSDEGPGIDPAQADLVFDKFERLGRDEDGAEESGGGSGLGLYISRRLARVMGGDLTFVAPDTGAAGGQTGATFRLTLPRA